MGGCCDDGKWSGYVKIGPVGSTNGDEWDEKGGTRIVQILVSHEDDGIRSIQFQYAGDDGSLLLSDQHGTCTGNRFDVVKLSHPIEYINRVSGYKSHNKKDICSITFGTNLGQHGPFGQHESDDEEFSFNLGEGRQFAGFHGTVDDRNGIRSIGVYLNPFAIPRDNTAVEVKLEESVANWEMVD